MQNDSKDITRVFHGFQGTDRSLVVVLLCDLVLFVAKVMFCRGTLMLRVQVDFSLR